MQNFHIWVSYPFEHQVLKSRFSTLTRQSLETLKVFLNLSTPVNTNEVILFISKHAILNMIKSAMIESRYRPEVTDDAVYQMSFFRSVWTGAQIISGVFIYSLEERKSNGGSYYVPLFGVEFGRSCELLTHAACRLSVSVLERRSSSSSDWMIQFR